MKTLLCVIVAITFLALPLMAQDVKTTFDGSRLAAGYMDNGSQGENTPGTFAVPEAKLRLNATFDKDTSAVLRLNFNNAAANGADYAYVKLTNVVKKLAKSKMVNPDLYVGLVKVNFGEETWSNNPVENALVQNSIGGLSGHDAGVEFRQNSLPIELPVVLGYSLSFMNGGFGGNPAIANGDDNNVKAYALKVMGTMKSMPMYFSLSQYDSGRFIVGSTPAMMANATATAGQYIKGYELNVRYDLLEGAQKFTPTTAPLASDAKAVLRLAYGQGSKGTLNMISEVTTMMLDAVFNVDKQWYAALRYSSTDNTVNKFTRTTVGGGHRLSDKAILKLDYTMNAEPSALKTDNDSVSLLITLLW